MRSKLYVLMFSTICLINMAQKIANIRQDKHINEEVQITEECQCNGQQ